VSLFLGEARLARLAAALVTGLTLVAAPALADESPTTRDIRCVIVGATMAGSNDPQVKQIGTLSVLYFWGRLQGRGENANISARVLEEESHMSEADFAAEAKTCEAMVTGAGQDLQDLSKEIQNRAGASSQ
jgi:hypothetical protein